MGYSLSPNDIKAQASRILLTAASNELAKSTKELNDFIEAGGDINSDAFKLIQSKVLSAQEAYTTATTSAYEAVKSSVLSSAYIGPQLLDDEQQKFEFKRKIELSADSEDIHRYLKGEEILADCENGWAVVMVDGCAVGGAKVVSGVAKNHYPKHLRKV